MVLDGQGRWELKEWKAASLEHIRELDPQLAKHPVHFYKNICQYQQPDGSWRSRSSFHRAPQTIFVERLGFTQVPGQPLRRKKSVVVEDPKELAETVGNGVE